MRHVIKIVTTGDGSVFSARCSCGWGDRYWHPSPAKANDAGDEHVTYVTTLAEDAR